MTNSATVALYSVDPNALDAFHSFDPESYSLILLISDALVLIGLDGEVRPGLAVSWTQVSPLEMELELRREVRFHNGDLFCADDVVATFVAHRQPTPSACGGGILSSIVEVTKLGAYRVRITTAFPDAMLLRRLFFSQIYPTSLLQSQGREALLRHPIGTGAYEFVHWRRGEEIVLRRVRGHWADEATVDVLHFPILRQKEWPARLRAGELDIALNVDSHQKHSADHIEGLHSASRDAALSQWFLLSRNGPLADARVRRALNYAVNQRLLVDITERSLGTPQRTVATEGQEGFNPNVSGYGYNPKLARTLLAEAGYGEGFTLRGLVSETSCTLYSAVRELLGRIGITLEADIVPRADWIVRVAVAKMTGERPYAGDFAVASVDNPLLHSLFHQFIFLFSDGPFSLIDDENYDRVFLSAATETNAGRALHALHALEQYAHDEALLLFTVQQQVHMIAREGFSMQLPRSGHFGSTAMWTLRRDSGVGSALPLTVRPTAPADVGRLLDATSHLGLFHMADDSPLQDPALRDVWRNIQASDARWQQQMEPMIRELVSLSDDRANLHNILRSTQRVAIVGVSAEGLQVFGNVGYEMMFGASPTPVTSLLGRVPGQPTWGAIEAEVQQRGTWTGPVVLPTKKRPQGAPARLYLMVSASQDLDGNPAGHTLVFSDFSGEEARIQNRAVRVILDHAADGLLRCDRSGHVMEGYSKRCVDLLQLGGEMQGRALVDVLRLTERNAVLFAMRLNHVMRDTLPEEITLGQLATNINISDTVLSLKASAIRDEAGAITSLLITIVDITDLIEAERDTERLKGVVRVLRFKDRFRDFVRRFAADLLELKIRPHDTRAITTALHNAKGAFGQFNLHELAQVIHDIEGRSNIGPEHLQQIYDALVALLDKHRDVWGIRLEISDHDLATTETQIAQFESAVAGATTLQELRALALRFTSDVRRRSVTELIGPLVESAQLQGARSNKRVALRVEGAQLRVDPELTEVFGAVGHLVRNAIDHGIEEQGQRGRKPGLATLVLRVQHNDVGLRVSLADDGAGIDAQRVAERALALGAITAAECAAMSAQEKCALVFTRGLSTSRTVSETVGRGVGMAAVRDAVHGIGGSVTLETSPGTGTVVTMFIPR